MVNRRRFIRALAASSLTIALSDRILPGSSSPSVISGEGVSIPAIHQDDDIFRYIQRVNGKFDQNLYKQILGAANEFKEGDAIVGLSAEDQNSRENARILLSRTTAGDLNKHPLLTDELSRLLSESINLDQKVKVDPLTLADLKKFILHSPAEEVISLSAGLTSEVIGCLVKLMTNDELIAVGARLFHALPGTDIGAKGYLGARIQPNSPTDNIDDIRWQVLDGWSYAVGDVVLGTNNVSSDLESIQSIELALGEILETFGIRDILPHCVLAHIDLQAEVEKRAPGSTAIWFQSIAGSDTANATFDISVEKMRGYAAQRTGQYGLYFETGQGADFTNGHSHGFDMVIHESRKYGFARSLKSFVAQAQESVGFKSAPWIHVNDVAGFIGPEVFRNREQLVRCCLEDIVMGKLHGLTIGLDVCSTLHMDISLKDLDWCLDQIMPANPAYLMALPTKIDPMLGYLTTGFQDHVRIRDKFGYKVNERMWTFFQTLGIIGSDGNPTSHFGDPVWVYLKYCRKKGDLRSDEEIYSEGLQQIKEVRSHGVFIAENHGEKIWELEPELKKSIERIYSDARECIWAELSPAFISEIPESIQLHTKSTDRNDYILHPNTGELINSVSLDRISLLRKEYAGAVDVQIVISDGLNALSITDQGHLMPFMQELKAQLNELGLAVSSKNLVLQSGRVRAGYRIGEFLFGSLPGKRAVLHIIGERPGTGHHTFSTYITAPDGSIWAQKDLVDHNITKVVSGVARTAVQPEEGARQVARILQNMLQAV